MAVLLALAVALAGFSGVSLSAPVGYPEDSLLGNGLVREIVFDPGDYRSPCNVRGRLVFQNPTDEDVAFDLEYLIRYNVSLDGVYYTRGGRFGTGESQTVTVPARGEYTASSVYFYASGPGFYEVEWDGLWRGIEVVQGDLVLRFVAEKQVYYQYENGYLTLEYYNPRSYPVSFDPPYSVQLWTSWNGGPKELGPGAYFSRSGKPITVPPGGTYKVTTFYFTTPRAGTLTFSGMGASRTLIVLPVER